MEHSFRHQKAFGDDLTKVISGNWKGAIMSSQ